MRRTALLAIGALAIALATTAGSARSARSGLINGSCPSTAPVFSPWNDAAGYFLAPNGGLESGSTGWSLSGHAAVVADNDPFQLSGAGSHALSIPAGSSASLTVCYGLTYPAIRFTAGGSGSLHVRVTARSLLGVISVLDGGTFSTEGTWAPSPKLSTLLSAVAAPLGTKSMQIQLSAASGTVLVDDLYVDPFLTKS